MTTTQKTETHADWKKRAAMEFAIEAKNQGFDDYIAERGNYGFYTDGERVVSFAVDLSLTLSGNYQPSLKSGTGWRISDDAGFEQIKSAIKANAPQWANKAAIYTKPEAYLKKYQASSKFEQV